ncbi:hypothetical protein IP91_04294 [Pseudoduganella lurida]|uniref:GAF domain-containing protein n=1 Tax=Pseudoduganella lurida TaxID=1036180 RepID=A0A562QZE4_9BURK|nr:hypothetical protein [Pseudoduganella lurida]TWI62185.1 hypothetical protein IP91_04294 [Pseudoduganella lurida]
MNKTESALLRLRDILVYMELDGQRGDILDRLSALACEILAAERCVITLFRDAAPLPAPGTPQAAFGELARRQRGRPAPADAGRDVMFAIIVLHRQPIGVIHVHRASGGEEFDGDDLQLFSIVTPVIGKSLQVLQLQGLLKSRFTQIALSRSDDPTIGQIVQGGAQNPNGIARILARAFYREMTNAGFDFNQILHAASEVISELTASLRKHSRHAPAPSAASAASAASATSAASAASAAPAATAPVRLATADDRTGETA